MCPHPELREAAQSQDLGDPGLSPSPVNEQLEPACPHPLVCKTRGKCASQCGCGGDTELVLHARRLPSPTLAASNVGEHRPSLPWRIILRSIFFF